MNMRTFLGLLATLGLTAWSSVVNTAPLKNLELDRALQGAWCNSDDGGKTCWGYDIFERGNSKYCGAFPESGKAYAGTSKYEIRGNRICHTVASTSDEAILKVGELVCFIVLDIDADKQSFRSVDDLKIIKLYRDDAEKIQCPTGGI